jgi:hypothetical protein
MTAREALAFLDKIKACDDINIQMEGYYSNKIIKIEFINNDTRKNIVLVPHSGMGDAEIRIEKEI